MKAGRSWPFMLRQGAHGSHRRTNPVHVRRRSDGDAADEIRRERIRQDGNEPVGNSVEEFVVVIKETVARWRKAEKAARVRP